MLALALSLAGGNATTHAQSPPAPCDKHDKNAFRNCIASSHPPRSPAAPLERFLEAESFIRSKSDPPGIAYYRWIDNSWRGSLANHKVAVVLRVDTDGRILDVKVN